MKPHHRRIVLLDLGLVFLFTAVLIRPLFQAGYLDRWDSIESTFISDGRFLRDHGAHPQWQPLWYCGTRFDYIYPPALRYGTAILAHLFLPVQAYHVYTALLYCVGIAGMYLLARVASGSRGTAWLAAAGAALVSPAFLLISQIRWDAPYHTPWRLWVMLRYGEGPHICSVALLPFALAFAYRALERWRPASLAAAAVFCALVALTNFYGATALAILYGILVWSMWVTGRDRRVWLRAAAIAALAYGLAAFWLTPSYLRVTIENLRWVSVPGNRWSATLALAAAAIFVAGSLRWAYRKPKRTYAVFLCGSLLLMGLNVVGRYSFNFRVIGEPHRLAPELDLVMILAGVEGLRRLWECRVPVARVAALLVVLAALWSARHYIRHAWEPYLWPPDPSYRERVEHRMSEWIEGHLPGARAMVTGSNRLWWDTWHDLAQVGGASDQGQLNPYLPAAQWELIVGASRENSLHWLAALGADAIIVPQKQSQEIYHEFHHPEKFAGALPVLYDDGLGNIIYGVPRRYPSLARVVDTGRLRSLPPMPGKTDFEELRAYAAMIEEGPDALTKTEWAGTDRMRIRGRTAAGQSILVQVTYDPAWHAYLNGKALAVHKDPLDFSVIEAPPGDADIAFVFETPLENRFAWTVTLLSLLTTGVLISRYA